MKYLKQIIIFCFELKQEQMETKRIFIKLNSDYYFYLFRFKRKMKNILPQLSISVCFSKKLIFLKN